MSSGNGKSNARPVDAFSKSDLLFAYEEAAACMEQKEFGGDDPEPVEAAYREVARRLRRSVKRMNRV